MLSTLLFSLLSQADAANYYLSPVGLRSLSRGGAFIAGADDISAQWNNPAALSRISGSHFQLYTVGVKQFIHFDRTDYPGEGPDETDLINEPVSNEASILPIPHFGYITDFGTKKLTLLLGFTSPYATGIQYPQGGPQRYAMEDSMVIHTFTGPSIAYQATPWLSLGVGASWNYLIVGQSKKVAINMGICNSETENPECDVSFDAMTKDPAAFAWNISTLIEPESKKWAIGLMMQPKIHFNLTGNLEADFTGNYFYEADPKLITSQSASDDEVKMEVDLPNIYRLGFLVRPKPNLEIELAGVYEGWKILPSLNLTDINMTMTTLAGEATITDDITIDTYFTDTYSIRLGWEWDISEKWTVRNGYLYETTGLPEEYLNVGTFDRNKYGYGLGGTWNPTPSWSFDAGIFQSFMGEIDLQNSAAKQTAVAVNPLDQSTSIVDGRTINDGVYSSAALLVGLGMSYHFGMKEK